MHLLLIKSIGLSCWSTVQALTRGHRQRSSLWPVALVIAESFAAGFVLQSGNLQTKTKGVFLGSVNVSGWFLFLFFHLI